MRKFILPAVIIISSIVLIVRIFYLQVIDETLKLKSENNAIKKYLIFLSVVIFMIEMASC